MPFIGLWSFMFPSAKNVEVTEEPVYNIVSVKVTIDESRVKAIDEAGKVWPIFKPRKSTWLFVNGDYKYSAGEQYFGVIENGKVEIADFTKITK